ncbi:hypothetical protein EOD42_14235 [Rhodovarius crocodyli]|uniref:Uncharacterized protein n=1 Tax=Rhodovarius crocodyli TaxID=1979269 RepID=A0A437MF50_9PROT|nr:hypothetical protein [Rhodovarius crocodyli]RVT96267.1 hypothetical protein EOD42_14235 [Rhodovarius crocodyli]
MSVSLLGPNTGFGLGNWAAAGGLLGPSGLCTLVSPGWIAGGTFSRVGSKWDVSPAGVLTEYGSNVPVFGGANNWLSIEGQRTNSVRNPRHEGAVAGTPGTSPANGAVLTVAGIAYSIVGTGVEYGYPYLDIEWGGTATAAGYLGYQPEPNSGGITASQGQTWTASSGMRVVGGSLTNVTNTRFRLQERTPSAGSAIDTLFAPSSSMQLVSASRTLTDAGTVAIIAATLFQVAIGATIALRARFFYFGAEQALFASSPAFPAVGSPAQSTRNADQLAFTLAQAGLQSDRGTVLFSGVLPQLATSAANQGLFILHAGGDSNRIAVQNQANTSNIRLFKTLGGTTTNLDVVAGLAAGAPFSVGMTFDANSMRIVARNGAVQTLAGPIPSGLTTAVIGMSNAALTTAMFGRVGYVRTLPYAVSDGQLQSHVNGMPLT